MKINYSKLKFITVITKLKFYVSTSFIINFNKIYDVKILQPILTYFLKNHLFTTYFGLQNF